MGQRHCIQCLCYMERSARKRDSGTTGTGTFPLSRYFDTRPIDVMDSKVTGSLGRSIESWSHAASNVDVGVERYTTSNGGRQEGRQEE